ncbi:hypothetical protein MUK70_19070 [Dyadobacter chenwenxiniae]|uniref:cAMP-binding domain of CRP or a regulatory subunit of cAMP-dependent protein kinases n=1 Tax=Dyadobacter chenwenxiniae TaxID=2906456 RepID=A0A9X1PIB6_9BACT|nr:hypothetical protein [Dyadobacter chenwenxiniae]MCF0061343.1 hypothetical protein [Dyadobacter chenwenxiniae]UON81165.1 hypothetical protein MUK70_19070 [Dyadobacter chenwenxiniae]
MDKLLKELKRHILISENLVGSITLKTEKYHVKAKQKLLVPNVNQEHLLFVVSGIARNYYISDTREWTSRFFQPGDFVLSIDNFLFDLPCTEFIESCTPMEVIRTSKADYKQLFIDYPELNIVARNIADERLKANNDRMYSWRMLSAAERYDEFVRAYPNICKQVQIQHIASYLDISPYNLSRIRSMKL